MTPFKKSIKNCRKNWFSPTNFRHFLIEIFFLLFSLTQLLNREISRQVIILNLPTCECAQKSQFLKVIENYRLLTLICCLQKKEQWEISSNYSENKGNTAKNRDNCRFVPLKKRKKKFAFKKYLTILHAFLSITATLFTNCFDRSFNFDDRKFMKLF